jgi:hypothetical protein
VAYGPLGLTPEQLGKLTPKQLNLIASGCLQNQELEWYRTAWQTAAILNCWKKKTAATITPEKLLGKDFGKRGKLIEKERYEPEFLKQEFDDILKEWDERIDVAKSNNS